MPVLIESAIARAAADPCSALETWRDRQERPALHSGTAGGCHWIALPGVARYVFEPGAGEVRAEREPGATQAAVVDGFERVIVPMVLAARGVAALHASAVRGARGVIAFCAESGAGKSTLALGLAARGYEHFADDALAVTCGDGAARAHRWPHRNRFRAPTLARFGDAARALPERHSEASAPLAMLCVLERAAAVPGGHVLDELAGAQALTALFPHAHYFSVASASELRAFTDVWLDVVATVPVLRVRFVPELALLDALLDALESAALRADGT